MAIRPRTIPADSSGSWRPSATATPRSSSSIRDLRARRRRPTCFCQIRAGADIAFLGGLINYAIENNRVAKDYLVNYTNAAFIIKDGFKLPEDGLFSGFDDATKTYDKSHLELPGGRQRDRQGRAGCGSRRRRRQQGHEAKAAVDAGVRWRERRGGCSTASSVASAERRLRPVAAASALRLSTAEAAVFPLHAGDGGAHHRHSARTSF